MKINDFYNKKILVVGCHQDDETLFCGGLLTEIYKHSKLHLICTSKPYPNRPDTHTREKALSKVCDFLNMEYIQLNFDDPGPKKYPQEDFNKTLKTLKKHISKILPDIIITHNKKGEYGHIYHTFIHDVIASINPKCTVLNFGVGLDISDFFITFNEDKKNQLFNFYKPQWNGVSMYPFALKPELYKIWKK